MSKQHNLPSVGTWTGSVAVQICLTLPLKTLSTETAHKNICQKKKKNLFLKMRNAGANRHLSTQVSICRSFDMWARTFCSWQAPTRLEPARHKWRDQQILCIFPCCPCCKCSTKCSIPEKRKTLQIVHATNSPEEFSYSRKNKNLPVASGKVGISTIRGHRIVTNNHSAKWKYFDNSSYSPEKQYKNKFKLRHHKLCVTIA